MAASLVISRTAKHPLVYRTGAQEYEFTFSIRDALDDLNVERIGAIAVVPVLVLPKLRNANQDPFANFLDPKIGNSELSKVSSLAPDQEQRIKELMEKHETGSSLACEKKSTEVFFIDPSPVGDLTIHLEFDTFHPAIKQIVADFHSGTITSGKNVFCQAEEDGGGWNFGHLIEDDGEKHTIRFATHLNFLVKSKDGTRKTFQQAVLECLIPFSPELEPIENFVFGIDFGNTGTTVAVVDPSTTDVTKLTPSFLESEVTSYESSVLFKSIKVESNVQEINLDEGEPSFLGENTPHELIECVTEPVFDIYNVNNWLAMDLAPKRSIGMNISPATQFHVKTDGNSISPVSVSSLLAAEAKLSEFFEKIQAKYKGKAKYVVATHPTTYQFKEVQFLRKVVCRAMLRAEGKTTCSSDDFNRILTNGNFEVVDEASASAFYYLYELVFKDNRGKLPEYRFSYAPITSRDSSANLLIIDVGGSTTDVVLVSCKVGKASGSAPTKVEIKPLNRTGMRDFGGDDITAAAFKVVKAILSTAGDVSLPSADKNFDKWYSENEKEIEIQVRTKFQELNPGDGEFAERYKNSMACFQLAEFLKQHARTGTTWDKNKEEKWKQITELSGFPDEKLVEVRKLFGSGAAFNWICKLIEQSLGECSQRINSIIGQQEENGVFVDHVFLVGQGSLFPGLRQKFLDKLDILLFSPPMVPDGLSNRVHVEDPSFIESIDREFEHKLENLKGSVGLGACIAKALEINQAEMKVVWDKGLSEKQPVEYRRVSSESASVEGSNNESVFNFGEELSSIDRQWRKLVKVVPASNLTIGVNSYFEGESEEWAMTNPRQLLFKFEDKLEGLAAPLQLYIRYVHVQVNDLATPNRPDYFEVSWSNQCWSSRIDPETGSKYEAGTKFDPNESEKVKAILQVAPPTPPMLRGDL